MMSILTISKSFNNTFQPYSVNRQQSGNGPWILKLRGAETNRSAPSLEMRLISLIAANFFIKKDEKLVKSADRIR